MKNTRSAKAKGRRLQIKVRDQILLKYPELTLDDVRSTPASVPGEDIQLSPKGRRIFPFSIECKNQEKLNIWKSLEQAETNAKDNTALLIFKRNHSKTYVVLELDKFLSLL